ncbi:putative glutaredoxin [Lyophyllum shimeji]|uniref:Monothiol glutaredoxin-5, mitochondrial n=1 Tax=Lyophyllum shimeji TaxID=47721 RepID=A0A9P3PX72_LYOSH|nr:putative glutaredoxin [Lyophyllum shimeji]
MFRPALRSSYALIRSAAPFAHRHLTNEARSAIQKAINSSPVVLFMKGTPQLPECGFSRAVVQVLDLHGVPPEKMQTYNVLADQELRSGIKEFSEWPTIPQVYVNGEFLGGCDILLGMHQSGELEDLLVKHKIISEELPTETPQGQTKVSES